MSNVPPPAAAAPLVEVRATAHVRANSRLDALSDVAHATLCRDPRLVLVETGWTLLCVAYDVEADTVRDHLAAHSCLSRVSATAHVVKEN